MAPTTDQEGSPYDFGSYSSAAEAPAYPRQLPPGPVTAATPEWETLKHRVHTRLVETIQPEATNKLPEARRRVQIQQVVEQLLDQEGPRLNAPERQQMVRDLLDDILGLGPLEAVLQDPTVTDILVNGPSQVYVERGGVLEETAVRFRDADHLLDVIRRIVSRVGRRVDETSPVVDARLADGSRVNAVIPPLSLRGPTLSIRRFGVSPLRLADLLRLRSLAPEMAQFLEAAVKARLNIVISGGTGSGKTTLLNVLSGLIPDRERIISVEDAAELQLQQRHVVQLEARPANVEGKGAVSIRDLVRNTLRMRPNRIIVGECRGPEALDMMQAMNTGHEGSMTTLHANSPRDALSRLEMMMMMSGLEVPLRVLREQIASAVYLIIQVDRLPGGPRRIMNVTEVVGMEKDVILHQDLFVFRQEGLDSNGKAFGQFEATGIRLSCTPRVEAAGIKLPADLFQKRVLLRA